MFRFILLGLQSGNLTTRYAKAHEGWFFWALMSSLIYLGLCVFGLYCNIAGGQWINFIFAGLFQLAAFLLLFMPGNVIAVAIIGFLLGQPGNTPGLSISDGVNQSQDILKKFGGIAGSIIFYGSIPFVAMGIFSFKGHAFAAIIMLALAAPVAIAASRIFKEPKLFITLVYWVEVIVLIAALGLTFKETYWTYAADERDQIVREIDATYEGQIAEADKQILKGILKKAEKGIPLSKNDFRILGKYQERLNEKSPQSIGKQIGETAVEIAKSGVSLAANGLDTAKAETLKAWNGEELTYQVTVSSKGIPEVDKICNLSIGNYKVSVRDVTAPSIVDEKGDDMGVFDLSNTGRPGTQFGLTVGGKRVGETVTVSSKDSCLTVAVSMNGPTRAFFTNESKYKFVGEATPAATLVLTR
ncbi:MAG: hypothetical protein KA115_02345 [Candidatus Moranbacteria bacterium]|nr:hypothetical protein [Candidatus Moranbacteria bacterium]